MSIIKSVYPEMGLQMQLQFLSRKFEELPPEVKKVLIEKAKEPKKAPVSKPKPAPKKEPTKIPPGKEEENLIEYLVQNDKLGPEDAGKYVYDRKRIRKRN